MNRHRPHTIIVSVALGAFLLVDHSVAQFPNFRIYPSTFNQTEVSIARHPFNPAILFVSGTTVNLAGGFISEGIYVTTNSGQTWFGSDTCKGAIITAHGGEPSVAIDRNGRFLLIRRGFSPGLYSHYSTDNGINWSVQYRITQDDLVRGVIASDVNPQSAYYGRSYAVWVRFALPFPVVFSYTDNGAVSWSTPVAINSPSQRGSGGKIAMGPNASVNVCWAAVINASPFTEDFVGFAVSTNGGANWVARENAYDMNGIAGSFPQKGNIRVNGEPRLDVDRSGGPRNGWIYIVTTERALAPAGNDPDLVVHRSTDGGATWSAGIRANQDALNNGKYQYFPTLHVDDGGGVNILYYDDRSTTADSASVYLSRSTDGGNSWNYFRISSRNFMPQPIAGLGQGYQGDNIALTSVGDTLWAVWMDNLTGIYQLWASPIRISSLVAVEDHGSTRPSIFNLKQNYPNPFNPSTTIAYELPARRQVTLQVFDVFGREVATLVNGEQEAGAHSVEFNTGHVSLASGIYLYRISSGGSSMSKKMLLLK